MSLCFHSRFAPCAAGSNEDVKKFNAANMKTRSGKETAALKDNSRLWQTIREKTAYLNKSSYKTLKRSYGGNFVPFSSYPLFTFFSYAFWLVYFVFYIYFSSDARYAQTYCGVQWATPMTCNLDKLDGPWWSWSLTAIHSQTRERMVFVLL